VLPQNILVHEALHAPEEHTDDEKQEGKALQQQTSRSGINIGMGRRGKTKKTDRRAISNQDPHVTPTSISADNFNPDDTSPRGRVVCAQLKTQTGASMTAGDVPHVQFRGRPGNFQCFSRCYLVVKLM
jgi:hypothetical protein